MQFLNILAMITLVWHNTSEIILEFPLIVQPALQSYPNLTCSCLRGGNLIPIIVLCMTMIVCYKIFLSLDSTCYLSMNHEKIFKIGLVYAVTHYVLEHLLLTIKYGTICVKAKVQQLIFVKGVQLEEDHFNTAFMVFPIHVIFLVIATLVLKISKCVKQNKCSAINLKTIFCCKKYKTDIEMPESLIYSISNNLQIPSVVNHAEIGLTDRKTNKVFCNLESNRQAFHYREVSETNNLNLEVNTTELPENGEKNCNTNQDRTENVINLIETIEVISLNDSYNENPAATESGDYSSSTKNKDEPPQIKIKSQWVEHNNLPKAISQVSIVDNAKITIGIIFCVVATIIILIVINSRDSGLKSMITIINSLSLHVSPIAWVLNSNEISDYMMRMIKRYL